MKTLKQNNSRQFIYKDCEFSIYTKWMNKFLELTKAYNYKGFIIYHSDGFIEIYIDGDCWLEADNYKNAEKKYLKIIEEWEQ